MNIETLLIITFSTFALLSALMVITLTNAVHSVLFLILVFCNTVGLLLLFGAEFLSFMLLIVYVGAIAVLFLFVVMMLNVKISSINLNLISLIPLGILVTFLFAYQFNLSINEFHIIKSYFNQPETISWIDEIDNISNIKAIGCVLYTDYSFLFLLSGLILLVAMIGTIILTMHQRIDVKKQKIEYQLVRNPAGVIKFIELRK
uniref:NADH-ubiquinone oxidoreductase chain 6 n=1 Tax=Pterocladiella musciformis TaxID=2699131 RepID=A0A1D8X7V1_9FLOR|nr:NADH dehydrogenase subunit 6 [Pterocladiella musciformis]AOX49083.1 NADH dehydrogenase subunit 6 [Pterocladiella musciformis]